MQKKALTDRDTIKELIKDSVDPEGLMAALGVQVSTRNNREIRGTCPVHGGDNPTSFCYRKQTQTWICFSHGCHETCGRDAIGLVMGVLKVGFREALEFLSNITGIPINETTNMDVGRIRQEIEMKKAIEKHKRDSKVYMPPDDVTDEHLEEYMKYRTDFFCEEKNGGFSQDILDFFEIGGNYYDAEGIQREVIPIRNDKGELVAYSGRRVDNDEEPKYRLTNGFQKDTVLYNLNNVLARYDSTDIFIDNLIVVEGFKALWFVHDLGFKNVVACMGSRITPGQARLLQKYVRNVILMFDGDEPGQKGMDAFEADYGWAVKVRKIKLNNNRSPDEYPGEEILSLLKNIPKS